MSIRSGITVTDKLAERFKGMREKDSEVGFCQARIENSEHFEEIFCCEGTASYKSIADQISADENKASAYFFLKQAPAQYLIITWIPEDAAVKEKMVYASSLTTIKEAFGNKFITDDIQLHELDELTVLEDKAKNGTKEPSRESLFSALEKGRAQAADDEDTARKEQIAQAQERKAPSFQKSKSVGNGIGGFHSAPISLEGKIAELLGEFKSNSINWIAFSMDSNNKLQGEGKTVDVASIKEAVDPKEPRFYLFNYNGTRNVFFYCCPDASPMKVRMVYSTSKPGLTSSIESKGIDIDLKMEVSEASEMDKSCIEAELRGDGRKFSGPSRSKSQDQLTSAKAHPVFGQNSGAAERNIYGAPKKPAESNLYAAQTLNVGAGKKKIIIPPKIAYM